MLTFFVLLASALQDPLYPSPRFEPLYGIAGTADFDLDGLDDVYNWQGVLLSNGSLGGKVIDIVGSNGDPAVVDLNGDGYPDLAQPQGWDGVHVRIFEPATETFAAGVWELVFAGQSFVAGGDVDGDGKADVFSSGGPLYTVQLGDGLGGTSGHVDGQLAQPFADPALGDLDEDGLDDLVASTEFGSTVLLVALATGGGALAAPSAVSPGAHRHPTLADLDGDGHLDVVATTAGELRIYLGDGSGGLQAGAAVPLPWSALFLHVVDFDGNGTLDALAGPGVGPDHELLAAYGDGQGGFASTEVLEHNSPHHDFAVGDPDGDGDVEVIFGSYYSGGQQYGVTFFERDAGGGLVAPVALLDLQVKLGYDSMLVGDADQDGDHDLLVVHGSFEQAAKLVVGRNDGTGALAFETGPPLLPLVSRVLLGDVAGDGTTDLLGFPSTGIGMTIQKGDGQGGFGPAIIFPLQSNEAAFADWSSDGYADLLAPHAGEVLFHAGGTSYSFAGAVPVPLESGGGTLYDVEPGDLDLDGDLDAVVLVQHTNRRLYPLVGNGAGSFTPLPFSALPPLPGGAQGFDLGDFDADGLLDALLSDGSWCRGSGTGQFVFAGQPYPPPFFGGQAGDVHVADLDGDGIDDAVIDDGAVLLGGTGGLAFDRAYHGTSTLSVAVGNLTGNGPRDLVVQDAELGYALLPRLSGCLGSFTPYGAGCAGSTGLVPVLAGSGCPTPAGSWALDVSGGLPSTIAYASFGLGQGAIPLPNGCTLLLNPWLQIFIAFTLDASGQGSLPIAVSPESPTGFTVTSQVGLFDPGAPGFFTLTNGLAITVR